MKSKVFFSSEITAEKVVELFHAAANDLPGGILPGKVAVKLFDLANALRAVVVKRIHALFALAARHRKEGGKQALAAYRPAARAAAAMRCGKGFVQV